jgi:Holliday junction resolvasome RuvABC endonuclease subunit
LTVLGLDTSSLRCGWGVVRGRANPQAQLDLAAPTLHHQYLGLEHIEHGVVELDKKEHHLARQSRLQDEVAGLILFYGVTQVAIEDLKSIRNAKVVRVLQSYITAASLATWRSIGAAPILIAQARVYKRIGIHAPSAQEKRGLTSKQLSEKMKSEVNLKIKREFDLEGSSLSYDETDALSVAIASLGGP